MGEVMLTKKVMTGDKEGKGYNQKSIVTHSKYFVLIFSTIQFLLLSIS